jgi:hypothetical protein
MIEPSSQELSVSEFVQAVKAGTPIPDAIKMWGQKSVEEREKEENIRKAEELKKSLFANEPQERQSSSSLRTADVLEAIEALKLSASKKFCRQRVRLNSLQDIYDAGTTLIQAVSPDTGYHVVIEKGRTFSLKMTDPESATQSMMTVLSERCRELTGHWPTCISIKTGRFLVLNEIIYQNGYWQMENEKIPFVCAPYGADYDVEVAYDEVGNADSWIQDRKVS